jgi:hypothetical protein
MLILLYIIITLQCIFSIQAEIMYSFGPNSGDISLAKNDDGSYGPIKLSLKLPFFSKNYSTLYVNTNGLISFLSPISKPNSDTKYPISMPLISPFWSDINTLIGGQIY